LCWAQGESVALVGHSGAGKFTCANLLLRLWDVKGRGITIGGYDLRQMPQSTVREMIAYVPQDVHLFNRSVRENIRLGQANASDAAVEETARLAQALEFIEELPEGWATQLGERGARLSGGQRQRIAIARALLKDAPILLLDEAVSSQDVASEGAVQTAIHQARRGRTTLIIAHRLSTICTADRIVVLDGGRVVETGSYEQLVAAGGAFTRLTTTATELVADRLIG
jgi:ABC-type multidrug transport system fused ATPase/permease subunit